MYTTQSHRNVVMCTADAFTKLVKIVQSHASLAMIHNLSSGQQRERVKELEDGVARLVDGQYYHSVYLHTETRGKRMASNGVSLMLHSKAIFNIIITVT